MSFSYSVFRFSESSEVNLTAFIDGQMYSATDSHPNFERIERMCREGDHSVVDLFDISNTAQERFRRLSERVSISNGVIYFDGEQVDNSLTQQVVRFINDGVDDFEPLILFFEKVENNPNPHSREQLYRWLADRDFTINQDGNIVAYKGVKIGNRDEAGAEYFSIHHGTAIVDGLKVTGAIPNNIGSVIEMPRADVQHDPSRGCHTGLHAGTWNYASGFAQGAVLTVEINPRDVVSVPTDCEDQKMRVCRYTVTGVTEQEIPSALHMVDTNDVDDYDDEEAGLQELDPVTDESDDEDDESLVKFDNVQHYTPVNWLSTTYEPDDPSAPWNA